METLGKQLTEMGTDLTSRTEVEHAHFTDSVSKLDKKCTDACGGLRSDLAAASTGQAKAIDELVEEMGSIQRLATENAAKAEAALGESHSAMDAKFTESLARLQKQLSDRLTSLDSSQGSKLSALEQALDQAKVRSASATSALDDKYSTSCGALKKGLAESSAELKGVVEDLRISLADRCGTVESSSRRQVEELASQLASASDDHRSAAAATERKLLDGIAAESESAAAQLAKLDSKLDAR